MVTTVQKTGERTWHKNEKRLNRIRVINATFAVMKTDASLHRKVSLMQPTRKGTRVYTRIQKSTGMEIAVRKRKQRFVIFIDNTETTEFVSQKTAMEAADRMADEQNVTS